MKKKKKILLILGLIVLLLGTSYAWFNYYGEGKNSEFVAGNLYLRLDDGTKSISIPNALPESASHARNRDNNTLTFTIRGKNESQDDVIYSILLNNGNDIEGKNRFDASDIRFDLVEIDGNNRTMLLNAVSYTEFNQTPIWEEVVRKETNDVVTHTYELRMWIDENVNFGEGPGIKYTSDEYANLFASIKIAVDGHATDKNYQKLTFDGQGGEVERAYKYIEEGESYGELSTLTKEGYTFVEWKQLPSDYEGLEYIASTGTQRIDTGVPGNNDDLSFEIKYEWTRLPSNGSYLYVFGNYVNEETDVTRIVQYGSSTTYSEVNKRASAPQYTYSEGRSANTIYIEKLSNDSYEVNGNSVRMNGKAIGNANASNIFLFAANATAIYSARIKLYEFKIYDDNTLIRYFIPCRNKDTGIVGLYDVVNDVFYTDTNSNEFDHGERTNDVVLVAKWDKIPEMDLSKETYLEQNLTTWISNDVTFNSGIATLNSTESTLESSYIPVNGEFWYMTLDAYTENLRSDLLMAGVTWQSYNYDNDYNVTSGLDLVTKNGYLVPLKLDEWNNDLDWYFYNDRELYQRYGPNVKYVKILFLYMYTHSSVPVQIRNVKIHGQMPNSFYLIKVNVDDDNLAVLKYAKGNQNVEYFASNGTNIVDNQARVTENGIYTVYAKDSYGHEVIDTIEITNIE